MDETPTTPTEEPVPTEVAPEPPAPVVDDIAARAEELAKKERDLQRGFDEIARREREIAARTAPAPASDDTPDFDEATNKALHAKVIDPLSSELATVKRMLADQQLQQYAASSGIDAGEMRKFVSEQGIDFASVRPEDLPEAFRITANYMKAQSFDESAVEERIRAKVLAEMAANGERIDSVTPSTRTESSDVALDWDDESVAGMSFAQRAELAKKHLTAKGIK